MAVPTSIPSKEVSHVLTVDLCDKLLNIFFSEPKLNDHVWWICIE